MTLYRKKSSVEEFARTLNLVIRGDDARQRPANMAVRLRRLMVVAAAKLLRPPRRIVPAILGELSLERGVPGCRCGDGPAALQALSFMPGINARNAFSEVSHHTAGARP